MKVLKSTEGFPDVFLGTEEEIPIPQPTGYRIIVRPKPPRDKVGMIHLAERTKNADAATKTIGQLVAIGELAWKTKTEGVDLSADSVGRSMAVGDWVVFRVGSGQKLKFRSSAAHSDLDEAPDKFLLIMTDTDVLAKLAPDQVDSFYDWM